MYNKIVNTIYFSLKVFHYTNKKIFFTQHFWNSTHTTTRHSHHTHTTLAWIIINTQQNSLSLQLTLFAPLTNAHTLTQEPHTTLTVTYLLLYLCLWLIFYSPSRWLFIAIPMHIKQATNSIIAAPKKSTQVCWFLW